MFGSLSNLSEFRRPPFVASGSSFSPLDIAGLQLWLDASQIVGLSDGDPVATWPDMSGNGRDISQAVTILQPYLRVGALNGNNYVDCDAGAGTFLSGSDAGLPAGGSARTSFSVIETTGSGTRLAWFYGTAAANQTYGIYQDGGNAGLGRNSNDIVGAASSGWHVLTTRETGSGAALWIDGVLIGTGSAAATVLNQLMVGKYGAAGLAWDSGIAQILLYDSALSTGDREAVEDYLMQKYAIS